MKDKGFTLIEVIVVIALLAIVIAIAAPNIFKFSSNANEKALKSKIDNLAKTAEIYIENNSNDIRYKCQNYDSTCICVNFSQNSSNFTCKLKIQTLVNLMLYQEKCTRSNSLNCTCKISNPTDESNCLENNYFIINYNSNSNVATATFTES